MIPSLLGRLFLQKSRWCLASLPNKHVFLHVETKMCQPEHLCNTTAFTVMVFCLCRITAAHRDTQITALIPVAILDSRIFMQIRHICHISCGKCQTQAAWTYNKCSLGFKSWQVCLYMTTLQIKRIAALGLKGFITLLTLQQVGHLLPVGSDPAASRWQSPWLLCHPADSDQVEGTFLFLERLLSRGAKESHIQSL